MSQFASRRDPTCRVRSENDLEWLEVQQPTQLANFIAFCKARGKRIYLRGEHSRHLNLLPSLFREPGQEESKWRAYRTFIQSLSAAVIGTRFKRQNFGAVLQHYGFRTSWLDVVDNFYVAIWFALNNISSSTNRIIYRRTEADSGWVVLISAPAGVRTQDLRETQSSRNTRCHAQQGRSLALQSDDERNHFPDQNFSKYVVGRVKIPNTDRWHLAGFMATQSFLFPNEYLDDTYKQLNSPGVAQLAHDIEIAEGLHTSALGRVTLYADASIQAVVETATSDTNSIPARTEDARQ